MYLVELLCVNFVEIFNGDALKASENFWRNNQIIIPCCIKSLLVQND